MQRTYGWSAWVLFVVMACEDAAHRDPSDHDDAAAYHDDAAADHDAGFDGRADADVARRDGSVHDVDATSPGSDARVEDAEMQDAEGATADARAEPPPAELVSLVPSVGVLVPPFQPDIKEYVLELPLTAAVAELTSTVADGAVLKIAGMSVASGEAWRSPSLAGGDNAVAIAVEHGERSPGSYALTLRKTSLPQVISARMPVSELGVRVALSQDTLLVAGQSSDGQRVIEVYDRAETGWSHVHSLVVSECAPAAPRMSLATDGAVIVLGCGAEPPAQRGSAYVFTRAGASWTGPLRLRADDGVDGDHFGESVAVSGELMVVGAPFSSPSLQKAGSAYVFKRTDGGWQQQARLGASNAGAEDGFGAGVAVFGTTIVASAPYEDSRSADGSDDDAPDSGAAYVFVLDGDAWVQQAYLKALRPDPSIVPQHGGDHFGGGDSLAGRGVALWEDTLAVGAAGEDLVRDETAQDPEERYASDVGAVYVFRRQTGSWSFAQRLVPSVLSAGGQFGAAVSVWAERLVVGAWQHDGVGAGLNGTVPTSAAASPTGAAFSFARSGADYVEAGRLGAALPTANARTGWSVAVSEHATALGAPGPSAREAYVFP